MSLSSVTSLAITRDRTHPTAELQLDNQRATWGKVLVTAIPTEILTVYTATLGVAAGLASGGDPKAYLPFRFAWYAAWIVATPVLTNLLYLHKCEQMYKKDTAKTDPGAKPRHPRWWKGLLRPETTAATIAAASWFTAMPGSPWQAALSGGAFALTSMSATAIGALLIGLVTPLMTNPNSELLPSEESPESKPRPPEPPEGSSSPEAAPPAVQA